MKLEHLVEADAKLRWCIDQLQLMEFTIVKVLDAVREADKRINWAYGEHKKEHEHSGEGQEK